MIAKTPKTPYYAVVFTSITTENGKGYNSMSDKMVELASQQKGFLGIESARNELGITVSYWLDLESIRNWKMEAQHTEARNLGREQWYKNFKVRICKVERDYEF